MSAFFAVRAASAAISPSIRRRAASSSNGLGPSSTSPTICAAPGSATKMPEPTRTSTRPAISSEMIASRTDVRDTPSSVASSRSAGRREPAGNSPLSINAAIWPAICRYSRSGSTVCNGKGTFLRDFARHGRCGIELAPAASAACMGPRYARLIARTLRASVPLVKWSNHRTNQRASAK